MTKLILIFFQDKTSYPVYTHQRIKSADRLIPKSISAFVVIYVTVKPAAVLPHQALSCNNRNKTKVYDCRPLYSIGFDRTRIAWGWYCVKWDQSYQGKQQSRRVVTSGRGAPQQRIECAKLVRAKRHCRQHFSLPSAKGLGRTAAAESVCRSSIAG